MSEGERERWNARYAEGGYTSRTEPSPFLSEWLGRIRPSAAGEPRALDLACGAGRNALRLAEAGYAVDAVDISDAAVGLGRSEAERRGLTLDWAVHDLDQYQPPAAAYELITVFRYRNEWLWLRLADGLAPNGWLIVEHHLQSGADLDGPPTDEFRVGPGEFLRAFHDLRIVHYSETVEHETSATTGGQPSRFALARIVACKGDPSVLGPPELATP